LSVQAAPSACGPVETGPEGGGGVGCGGGGSVGPLGGPLGGGVVLGGEDDT